MAVLRNFTFVFLGVLGTVGLVNGLSTGLYLHTGQQKCFSEELGKHVLLMGEFSGSSDISVIVTGPLGSVFVGKDKKLIQTAFTTEVAGVYTFCIRSVQAHSSYIKMTIVHGPEARDYSNIAKKHNLDDVLLSLIVVEDKLKLYHNNISYMKEREYKLRKVNDATAHRVLLFCVFNIILLIGTAVLQSHHFRSFFRSKKII